MNRAKKGKRQLDRRMFDYEETRARLMRKANFREGSITCPGRVKLKH